MSELILFFSLFLVGGKRADRASAPQCRTDHGVHGRSSNVFLMQFDADFEGILQSVIELDFRITFQDVKVIFTSQIERIVKG